MRNKYFSIAIASLVLGILGTTVARADVLDDIKKKGTLVVGTKADYRPFGFLDPSGRIVGFEPDLAADVAKRLGVKLELLPVVASNRIQFLQQGKIDIMIASTSWTRAITALAPTSCRRSRRASRPGKRFAARRCA